MTTLPPIGGYILTGQLRTFHAAHPPIILRHDLTTDFFGIKEREAGWPDHHCFNVFPISAAALDRLREILAEDPRYDIDTRHSAFGWVPRPKAHSPQLDLAVSQPSLFATVEEAGGPHRPAVKDQDMPSVAVESGVGGPAYSDEAKLWAARVAVPLMRLTDDKTRRFELSAYRVQGQQVAVLLCRDGKTTIEIEFQPGRKTIFPDGLIEPVFAHPGWGQIEVIVADLVDAIMLAKLIMHEMQWPTPVMLGRA